MSLFQKFNILWQNLQNKEKHMLLPNCRFDIAVEDIKRQVLSVEKRMDVENGELAALRTESQNMSAEFAQLRLAFERQAASNMELLRLLETTLQPIYHNASVIEKISD